MECVSVFLGTYPDPPTSLLHPLNMSDPLLTEVGALDAKIDSSAAHDMNIWLVFSTPCSASEPSTCTSFEQPWNQYAALFTPAPWKSGSMRTASNDCLTSFQGRAPAEAYPAGSTSHVFRTRPPAAVVETPARWLISTVPSPSRSMRGFSEVSQSSARIAGAISAGR